jgi:hypothetical protein
MTVRTARKAHKCEHYRWCQRVDEPLTCSGTIEPGERYCECPEYGEPYHPERYHVACYHNMMAESAQEIPAPTKGIA